jgi:transglutaminase superfamily protein
MKRIQWQLLAALTLGMCWGVVSRASVDERWYVVRLQDQRAGWMVERVEEKADRIETSTEMVFSIGRGDASVAIRMDSLFVETKDFVPISMRSVQELGAMPIETRYEFAGDEVVITSVQGGRESVRSAPMPEGEWMTPGAASKYFASQHAAGHEQIVMTMLEPLSGLELVTSTITIFGEKPVEVMGKSVMALECQIVQSVMPGVTAKQFMTNEGRIVRSEINLGGLAMTVLLSEREIALMPLEPVELVASTLVKPSREIKNARGAREGHYELRIESGELPRIPDTGTQVVQHQEAQRAVVVVNVGAHMPAQDDDHLDSQYTRSSSMIDAKDERIIALTQQALRGAPRDALSQFEVLRRFVHEYIDEKSLGVGFASASEVCRVREGDCTEHGVLLAAMLRAAGFPSRVASGLIYADEFVGERGIFAYHVWTQALVRMDGVWTWIDLDATLNAETPFDATHICLGTSSLSDGETVNSMASLATLLGQLSIEVIDVR